MAKPLYLLRHEDGMMNNKKALDNHITEMVQ